MSDTLGELERDTTTSKKAKVVVTATPLTATPWVDFSMKADFPDKGGSQDGEKLKFDRGAGAFELSFDLVDKTTLGLAFYRTVAEAMWVVVGQICPTTAGNGGGAIIPETVTDKKLIVTNANGTAQTLTFALRFTGASSDSSHPPYVYDPKIINDGGGPLVGTEGDEDAHDERDD